MNDYTKETRLSETYLSKRAIDSCHSLEIYTIGQLLATDMSQFNRIRNFGKVTYSELIDFREKHLLVEHDNNRQLTPIMKVGNIILIPCIEVYDIESHEFMVNLSNIAYIEKTVDKATFLLHDNVGHTRKYQCLYDYDTLIQKLKQL